jgi:hypothetical protein
VSTQAARTPLLGRIVQSIEKARLLSKSQLPHFLQKDGAPNRQRAPWPASVRMVLPEYVEQMPCDHPFGQATINRDERALPSSTKVVDPLRRAEDGALSRD